MMFGLGGITAQSFIGKLNPFPEPSSAGIQDTVKILAVMVSFQTDNDAATFGNGKFGTIYSQDNGNSILDPLPHDKPYFEAHLEFVKNYANCEAYNFRSMDDPVVFIKKTTDWMGADVCIDAVGADAAGGIPSSLM